MELIAAGLALVAFGAWARRRTEPPAPLVPDELAARRRNKSLPGALQ